MQAGLGEFPNGGDSSAELGEVHRRGDLELGPLLNAHPRLGQHAEGALRTEEQPIGRRSRAGTGQPPGLADPGRSHDPQRLDEVIDVGVQRGVVPTGPGSQPTAEGGELETLWEEPKCVVVLAELVFQDRSQGAGLDQGRAVVGVDLQHPIHAGGVQRDERRVAAVLHAPDHRASAAEGNDDDARAAGPVEDVDDFRLGARKGHQVGCGVHVGAQGAHHVPVGLAVCVGDAFVRLSREHLGELCGSVESRRTQRQVVEVRNGQRIGRALRQQGAVVTALLVRQCRVRPAPTPPRAHAVRHAPSIAYGVAYPLATILNCAPVGSESVASRPNGLSSAGRTTAPPSSTALAMVASAS